MRSLSDNNLHSLWSPTDKAVALSNKPVGRNPERESPAKAGGLESKDRCAHRVRIENGARRLPRQGRNAEKNLMHVEKKAVHDHDQDYSPPAEFADHQ